MKFKNVKNIFSLSLILLVAFSINVFGADYGTNAGKWIISQITWPFYGISAIILIFQVIKKSISGIISTIIIAGIVSIFILGPERFSSIGQALAGVLGL